MKSWSWVLLILLTILIKLASWYPGWVERNYSRQAYPLISRLQRLLFGWIPISIGDLFYAFLGIIVLYKTFQFIRALFKKRVNRSFFLAGLQQIIFFILFVYVFFNLLWGLNYNRRGIADQLGLRVEKYQLADLDTLTTVLQQRLNYYARFVTQTQRDSLRKKSRLFSTAVDCYRNVEGLYPWLRYQSPSVKPSIYSYLGNYLGFQGYYNPFSGEAQVNTTVPHFIEPFVTTHEIAHQLGYAKENEANFVGYLACHQSTSYAFRYSVYYDMYHYALIEIAVSDTTLARSFQKNLDPQVIRDQIEFRNFYRRYRNPVESIVMWGYSQYLKANNQPEGKRSYNEVVRWLIAYYKKFGLNAL
jgi:hypothetical protein